MTNSGLLPADVEEELATFVTAARDAWGADLVSVVLFGSAAEGRLRRVSDVNVLVVAKAAPPAVLARLRPAARRARLRIGLEPMMVLESELADAATEFAEKFADARARHRVLHGADVLARLEIPPAALRARLKQSLLNLAIRQRRLGLEHGSAEDQAARAVASLAGPLRACAQALLTLEGRAAPSPREALEIVARDVPGAEAALASVSRARETLHLAPSEADGVLATLAQLTEIMRTRLARLA